MKIRQNQDLRFSGSSKLSESKFRPLALPPKRPSGRRRLFIIIAALVIIVILIGATSVSLNGTKSSSTTIALCYSLGYPQYSVPSLPATWSFSSCVVAVSVPASGRTPEIFYTISGPSSVNATVVASHSIMVVLVESDTLAPEKGSTQSMNSQNTEWKISIPCVGLCSIDVINNSTQDNLFTMNFQAS